MDAEHLNTIPSVISVTQEINPNPLIQSISSPDFTMMQPYESMPQGNDTMHQKPFIRIVEQPTQEKVRFRYLADGLHYASSLPGVNSTPAHKTYPTIEIVGYKGEAIVVVSCVTADEPYRPHPHHLAGRNVNGLKYTDGICKVTLNGDSLRTVFKNIGVRRMRNKDIGSALEQRKKQQVNPFNTKYSSKVDKNDFDMNTVRLCFQAFIKPNGIRYWQQLEPQVSEPIYDKRAKPYLIIYKICGCAARVTGGDRIILFCEKVYKDDIKIKFFEVSNNEIVWQDYGIFQQSDVHKRTAIAFKTPRYKNTDVTEPVKVFIQLERPSDGALSKPIELVLHPNFKMPTAEYSCPIEGLQTCYDDSEMISYCDSTC